MPLLTTLHVSPEKIGVLDYSPEGMARAVQTDALRKQAKARKKGRRPNADISDETKDYVDYYILSLILEHGGSMFVTSSPKKGDTNITDEVPYQHRSHCDKCKETSFGKCGVCLDNDRAIHRRIIGDSLRSLERRGFITTQDMGTKRRAVVCGGITLEKYISRTGYKPPAVIIHRKCKLWSVG